MPQIIYPSGCIAISFLLPWATALADISQTTAPDSGLKRWTLTQGALELQLVQRLPDQTRAFFLARGFPAATADAIARSCVFQTIARNTASTEAPSSVTIDLNAWQIIHDGKTKPVKLKEIWDQTWGNAVPSAARLAFRWATFPTLQTFEPAQDYNWGMISFGPPPGETIDIKVIWHENQNRKSAVIQAVTCPTDL
jgi:hypothetical protein